MTNKSFNLSIVGLILFIAITQVSCSNDSITINDNSNSDCKDIICTLSLKRISVSITDKNQTPIALDFFRVINIENENDITISLSSSEFIQGQQMGKYLLIEDGVLGVNQELQIQFKGFINNQEVVNSNYIVTRGCCHIDLVSGNLELIL